MLVDFHICISAPLTFLMRKALTDDFWGLDKNMNCTVPLKIRFIIKLYKKLERENEILKVSYFLASPYNFLLFVVHTDYD